MRLSTSFLKEEICCGDEILATARRGGDVSVLVSSWPGLMVARKFAVMKARCEGMGDPKRRRTTDAELSTLYGLNGIFTWAELAEMVGLKKSALVKRVQIWKRRMRQAQPLKEAA